MSDSEFAWVVIDRIEFPYQETSAAPVPGGLLFCTAHFDSAGDNGRAVGMAFVPCSDTDRDGFIKACRAETVD